MTGWTVVSNEIVWGGPKNGDNVIAPDGKYFLDLTSYGRVNPIGGVSQTISVTPGSRYHLSLTLFNPIDAALIGVTVNAGSASTTLTGTGSESFDFTATSNATPITIIGSQGGFFVGLDNVSVTAVPEPDVFAMLIGTAFFRRQSAYAPPSPLKRLLLSYGTDTLSESDLPRERQTR